MHQSDSVNELAKALALANKTLENASKSSKNPHFNSKYADLAECLNTVREALADNGLSVTQAVGSVYIEGKLHAVVETQLNHASGQWQRGALMLPVVKPDPQGLGAALTYGRRYGLAAIVGIAQEDDDGNTASGRTETTQAKGKVPGKEKAPAPAPPAPTRATDLSGVALDIHDAIRAARTTKDLQAAVEGVTSRVKDAGDMAALQAAFQERKAALPKDGGPVAVA